MFSYMHTHSGAAEHRRVAGRAPRRGRAAGGLRLIFTNSLLMYAPYMFTCEPCFVKHYMNHYHVSLNSGGLRGAAGPRAAELGGLLAEPGRPLPLPRRRQGAAGEPEGRLGK